MELVKRSPDRRKAGHWIPADLAALVLGLCIFGIIGWLSLRDPSLAFGRAIGNINLVVVWATALSAAFLTCAVLHHLVDRKRWNLQIAGMYLIVGTLVSAGVNDGLLRIIDSRFPFSESVIQAKVIYYCSREFNPGRCVDQLSLCPQCKSLFSPAERKELHGKLVQFSERLDDDVHFAEEALAQTGPLSEAAANWRKRQQRQPASH